MINQKQSLIEQIRNQRLDLPFSENLSIYKEPLTLYGKIISNRIGIQPLEGFDSDLGGGPTDLVRRRYLRFIKGGSSLIWFEACSVSDDGKSNPYQMALTDSNVTDFKSLIELMDKTSIEINKMPTFKVLQLTHSGRVSKDMDWNPAPLAARKNFEEESQPDSPLSYLASDEKIKRIIEEHIHAAILAAQAGFDAVDIKVCHGYFLSELLSAYNRPGPYGGDFTNRTRALFEIVDGIKSAVGNKIGITIRLNAFDSQPKPYGYGITTIDGRLKADLTETIKICQMLRDHGVELIDISASSPSVSLFGETPSEKFYKKYVSSADLLMAVRLLKKEVPEVKFMCTGLSAFGSLGAEIGAGGLTDGWFDIAGFGRQALAYPDFANDILSGKGLDEKKCCICCGNCFKLMDGHTNVGCIIKDRDIYLPLFEKHVVNRV